MSELHILLSIADNIYAPALKILRASKFFVYNTCINFMNFWLHFQTIRG